MPPYRMEKQFKRIGLPLSRSTLCNLFHQAASITQAIWLRKLGLVKDEPLVLADAYGGYNKVCEPGARIRAACWAHVRRKFFDAQANAPDETKYAIAKILERYKIEYEAVAQKILGTASHLALRKKLAPPILSEFESWRKEQKDQHLPKGPMGKAISYALDNLSELKVFISDVSVPLDNNASERALSIVALGRKNYLFAGNDEAAQNLAGLYSLMATCEMHNINPAAYLTDILTRVHTHPAKKIDELLPHRWKELFSN